MDKGYSIFGIRDQRKERKPKEDQYESFNIDRELNAIAKKAKKKKKPDIIGIA